MKKSILSVSILAMGLVLFHLPTSVFSQKITATGTGRTTGHIAMLVVSNPGKTPLTFTLGPYLIPSTKKFQGYAVPGVGEITVPPKESVTVPITGFCTNPYLPPAGEDEQLPDYDTWVNPDKLPPIVPGTPLSRKDGFMPLPFSDETGDVTYPGTDIPFPYTIDIDEHPEAAARLVIDIVRAIETTYTDLFETGSIQTPFSGDPQREEDAIEQQIIWHVLGIVTGRPYDRDDFHDNIEQQLESNIQAPIEEAPPTVRDELENGVDEFWNTFTLVGVEAKVLRKPSTNAEDNKSGSCRLVCPPEHTTVDGTGIHFEWQCEGEVEGAFGLRLSSDKSAPVEIKGLTGTGYTHAQPLHIGANYEAVLLYPTPTGTEEATPIAFTTESDCYRELQAIMQRLDSLWKLVQNAREELEGNPLVEEVRTIEMIAKMLSNPKDAMDMFDQWLGEAFPFPDLSAVEDPDDMVDYINTNINTIKQALEYAKKLLQFIGSQGGGINQNLISKIDAALSALEKQEDFESMYNNLRSAITDLRGFLGDQLQEYTQDKIRGTAQRILASRLGAKAAGSIMSAAMDAWNFIDALIKAGRIDEAKKLYYLMYFDMLKKARECPRYRIDETWNSTTNGLPQIEWADCREVQNKKVTLTAVVKCWVKKPGGAPNEGRFEERRINFAGGAGQLVRRSFISDCADICAFQFQLDLADLAAKADGCEHAYVEIQISVDGNPAVAVFGGVYRP